MVKGWIAARPPLLFLVRVPGRVLGLPRVPGILVAQHRPGIADRDAISVDADLAHEALVRDEQPAAGGLHDPVEHRVLLHHEERLGAHARGLGAVLVQPDELQGSVAAEHEETARTASA